MAKATCSICDQEFKNLKSHEKVHFRESDENNSRNQSQKSKATATFQCEMCALKFTKMFYLKRHEKSHVLSKGEQKFKCKFCSKCLKALSSLKTHEKNHTAIKPYHCDICSRDFPDTKRLQVFR